MATEPSPELDNEITQNPKRYDYADIQARRETELKVYDNFFGDLEIEELDNDNESYLEGFM